ncbi:hypothetical protein [Haloferax volcanii]|uniref:hypothetical protein n=1 Tax=Haloferax volcanii TaxID=2246 RepID=UPI00385FE2A2
MDLDRLIDFFDDEAGQKERVALVIYYIEKTDNTTSVTQTEVREEIEHSRSAISPSSVSTYFSRLRKQGWLTSSGDGSRLTHDGEDAVEELLDDGALDNPRDDLFISSNSYEEEKYKKLVEDINESYKYRIYDATMVLTRKYFEDLVFHILQTHYSGDDVQMFYDQENQRHYSFDELIDNLREGVPEIRQYSRELNRELVDDLRELKEQGNAGAHSIRVDFTDEEMEELSEDATRISTILYDVWRGVDIASNSN